MKYLALTLIPFFFVSCNLSEKKSTTGKWITGSDAEKIQTIEKQFRGFDHAMVETGYRYQELYWAGKDQNWEYANYQLDKIQTTIENGLERRPKRAKSAEYFLAHVLPEMKKAIKAEDPILFNDNFKSMTINCNSCHYKEQVSYLSVKTPVERQSPIRN